MADEQFVPQGWTKDTEQPFDPNFVPPTTTAPIADIPAAATTTQIPPKAGDNVLAVLEDRAKELAKPEPPAPTMQLSPQQMFAVGLLSAMDPDGYQKYVLPTLQLMQGQHNAAAAQRERALNREQQAFNALLGIAQRRDEMASREKMEKERAEDRDLNRKVAEARLEADISQKDALAAAREEDKLDVENMTKSTDSGLKSLLPQIEAYAAKMINDPIEGEAALAVRSRARAFAAKFSDYLQGGTRPTRGTSQQFATEFDRLQTEFYQASAGRAAREAIAARQNAKLVRRSFSPSQAMQFDDDSKLPAERVLGFAHEWANLNPKWITQYGATKIGAPGRSQLPESLLRMASQWQATAAGVRLSLLGKAVTQIEKTTTQRLLPDDISDMTVNEFNTMLKSLVGYTSQIYRSHIGALDTAGYDVQPYWDNYNKVIRPMLAKRFPTAIQMMELPPGSPAGSMTRFLSPEGVLTVDMPNGQRTTWTPDTPEEAVFIGRVMKGEHFSDADVRRNLQSFGFSGEDLENIWFEIKGERMVP